MMKILVISKLSPFTGGGLERVVKDILHVVSKHLNGNIFLTYMTYTKETKTRLRIYSSQVILIPILVPKIKILDVLYYNIITGFFAYKTRWNVIHTHGECGAGYAVLNKIIRKGSPHIHTYHGTSYLNILCRIQTYNNLVRPIVYIVMMVLSWLEMIAGKESTLVTVVSDSVKTEVIKYYNIEAKKINVISLGINENIFKHQDKYESRKILGLEEKTYYGLFIGTDLVRKGFKLACDVFKKLNVKGKCRLIVVGATDDAISNFLGYYPEFFHSFIRLSDRNLVRVYNSSDFFLFLSQYEAFGLTALEALCCGTPVIMLKNAAKFEKEDGILVCNNEKEIIKSILNLRDHNLQVKLSHHLEKTRQKYSIAARYIPYVNIYIALDEGRYPA